MPDKTEKKHKHLSLDEREEIQGCLDHGMTFKAIGRRIGKDQTTVSKEVKRHLVPQPLEHRAFDSQGNPLPPEPCPRHLKAPFRCNPCEKKHRLCALQKRFYHAKRAQKAYESLLVECREGTPLNRESFYQMDAIIAEQMKKGQHLYHISQTQNLGASTASVYRYLHKGYLSAGKMDFPRVVKFKPGQPRQREYIPKSAKLGRTYDDFLTHVAGNSLNSWVEMDTVIGRIGGKVILTLDFTFRNFQAGLLLDNKTSLEAAHKIKKLKHALTLARLRFGEVFPVILSDNGGEWVTKCASGTFFPARLSVQPTSTRSNGTRHGRKKPCSFSAAPTHPARSRTARRITPCSATSFPLAPPSTTFPKTPSTSSFPTSTASNARAWAANLPLRSLLSSLAAMLPPLWVSAPSLPPMLSSRLICSESSDSTI